MNISIKAKLYLLSSAAILALVALCSVGYSGITHVLELKQSWMRITTIQRDTLNLRRIEKDFLTLPEAQHRAQFQQQHDELLAMNLALANTLQQYGFSTELFIQLNQVIDDYTDSFYRVLEQQTVIGLDHKSGLHGTLREVIHQVEQVLEQHNSKALLADMLLLRRNEKDFMQRRQTRYHQQFDNNVRHFITELKRGGDAQQLELIPLVHAYQSAFGDVVHAYTALGLTENDGYIGEMRKQAHMTEKLLSELARQVAAVVEERVNQVYQDIITLIALVALGLLLACLWLVRMITRPVAHLVHHMQNIASGDGDLTVRLDAQGGDELAQLAGAFNRFVSKIQTTVCQVGDVAARLATASEESLNVSYKTGRGVDAINGETTQLVASMSQMVASAQEVAKSSADAKLAAEEAERQSALGGQVVADAVASINSLAGELDSVSRAITKLACDSEQISGVMEVIQHITEQTNLLALNAAIEAARAGESGRGFAVVADEVRGLAQRTHQATQEIQLMVENLQAGVSDTVRVVKASYDKSHDSVDKVAGIRGALTSISSTISAINDRNMQIASAAEEESLVAKEINTNIASISEQANQTHLGTCQMIETGQSLAELAGQLQTQVAQFRVQEV